MSYLSTYDNTTTSNSKLGGKANITDVNTSFVSVMNNFNNYDVSSVLNNKIKIF